MLILIVIEEDDNEFVICVFNYVMFNIEMLVYMIRWFWCESYL